MTRPRLVRAMVLAGAVTAAVAAAGVPVRSSHGARLTGDEPQYVLTAISLGEDASLDVSDELAAERWRPFHERAELPEQAEALAGGRRVSPHDPLLPALLALPVRAGGWVGARLALAAVAGALAAALVWVAARRFRVPVRTAVLAVLAFTLAPPLASYGSQVYPELPAALAVTLGVAAVTAPLDRRRTLLLGAVVVALPWLAVKYAPVAAALAAVGVWRLARDGRARLAVGLAAGLAVAGAGFVAAHLAWYGGVTPYAAGDHFVGGELTAVGSSPDWLGRSRRLVGLLVDREFGLAAWQPAWLLAAVAVGAVVRRRPAGWPALVFPLAAGWLTATFLALTMHGWWFPGRQVVVVLPLAVVAVAWWAERSRPVRRLLPLAVAVGAAVHGWLVVEGVTERVTWAVDLHRTANPLHRLFRLALPDERTVSGGSELLHLLWLAAVAALVAAGWRAATRRRQPPVTPAPRPVDVHTEVYS